MKKLTLSLTLMVLLLSIGSAAMAYTIVDDATGGDCAQIGAWDVATKTCTLTGDIYIADAGATAITIENNYSFYK